MCIGIYRVIKTKVRASLSVALDACALELSRVAVSGPCAELRQAASSLGTCPWLAQSTPAVVRRSFR
jgi:hypothetical protein